MAEYIDREALLEDLKTSVVFSGRPGIVSNELRGINKVINRIKAAPIVDVVAVVRCKDCIFKMPFGNMGEPQPKICMMHNKAVSDYHFCSDGLEDK